MKPLVSWIVAAVLALPISVDANDLSDADTVVLRTYAGYIESRVKLPPEAMPVDAYMRFYGFAEEEPDRVDEGLVIEAHYVLPEDLNGLEQGRPGIYPVKTVDLPVIADGRCRDYVMIWYIVKQDSFEIACSEHMPVLPPPS